MRTNITNKTKHKSIVIVYISIYTFIYIYTCIIWIFTIYIYFLFYHWIVKKLHQNVMVWKFTRYLICKRNFEHKCSYVHGQHQDNKRRLCLRRQLANTLPHHEFRRAGKQPGLKKCLDRMMASSKRDFGTLRLKADWLWETPRLPPKRTKILWMIVNN